MLHAATRAPDSQPLREHSNLRFQTGPFTYQLPHQRKSTLTVSAILL
jgi:hypothetical protein